MDKRIRTFQLRRASCSRRGPAGYPTELKQLAVSYAHDAKQAGRSDWTISRELGIGVRTLRTWCEARTDGFRPVEVVPGLRRSASTLRLRTRSGHEVDGLDVDGLARLLQALEGR